MFSLRIVISLWMAIALILIAAITLSITLTSSLTALRDIGSAHAATLLENANLETAALFDVAATQIDTLRNVSQCRPWGWPSEDQYSMAAWSTLIRGVYASARFRVSSQTMTIGDGVVFLFNEDPGTQTYQVYQYLPPLLTQRTTAYKMNVTREDYWIANNTLNASRLSVVTADRSLLYVNQVAAYPPGSDTYSYKPTFTARLLYKQITVQYSGFAVLPRHVSERHLPTFATISMSLGMTTISRYLANARSTDGTAAFALNGDQYMIGIAIPGGATDVPHERYLASKPPSSLSGCANVTNYDNTTAPPEIVCLVHRHEYAYAPLQQLSEDMVNVVGRMVREVTLDDARWFVAVSRVPLRMPGLRLVLILMTPEKDIIGDVVKSQNIAIGVSAAVVVVMAAASFAFIVAMLRPLDDVAERMLRAATFEPETEPLSMSAMQEVRDLQTAYKQMSAELNRIRSFVPQSVLQAGTANDISDGDDDVFEALDADLDASMNVQDTHAGDDDSDTKSISSAKSATQRSVASKSKRSGKSGKTGNSSKRSGAAVAAALDCSVRTQPVSVLVANCNGFYEKAMGMSRDEVVVSMASMVDRVMGEVKTKGGVLAFFHGDHFAATFNAVKPSPAHARNAAAVALALTAPTAGPRTSQGQLTLRAGVSTGKCLVGNVGSAEAKNFSVMGPAFTQALVLERLTRLYTTGEGAAVAALASRRTCEDIATNYLYEYVDLVQLPGSAQATLVGRLVGPKANGAANQHDTEWLYVVGADKSNDPHAASNAAMTELAIGQAW
jgi:class 3 adenylate cyclase